MRSRPITANAELPQAALAEAGSSAGLPSVPKQAPVDLSSSAAPASATAPTSRPGSSPPRSLVLLAEAALAIRLEGPGRAFLALRALALAFLVVALLKPQVGDEAPPTTVVAQASRGVDPAGAAVERRWAETAGGCQGACRVLEFGGAARAAGGPRSGGRARRRGC